jgi:hypothetical protein
MIQGIIGFILGILFMMAIRVVLFRLMVMAETHKIKKLKNKYDQWRMNL